MAIGIFTQPYAFSLVGPGLAVFYFMIVGFLVFLGMQRLIEVATDLNYSKANLEGITKRVIGKKSKVLVLVLLISSQMGCFVGANLFICESFSVGKLRNELFIEEFIFIRWNY